MGNKRPRVRNACGFHGFRRCSIRIHGRNKIPLSFRLMASDRLHVWWHVPAMTLISSPLNSASASCRRSNVQFCAPSVQALRLGAMQPDDAGVAHWPLTLGLSHVLVCDGRHTNRTLQKYIRGGFRSRILCGLVISATATRKAAEIAT